MAKRMSMTVADHKIVSDAVASAELHTDAEIVTIIARQSDAYHDVGLHWAILAAFLVPAFAAAFPEYYQSLLLWLLGEWTHELPLRMLFLMLLGNMLLKFLAVRYLLAIPSLRMLFTPGATKSRRVRRRAVLLFRTTAEARTIRMTGVLLYLSLNERRAEIVADETVASKVEPEMWGDAMAALIDQVKQDHIAQGMADAVARIGLILAQHCPRLDDNPNELPDRLIEL